MVTTKDLLEHLCSTPDSSSVRSPSVTYNDDDEESVTICQYADLHKPIDDMTKKEMVAFILSKAQEGEKKMSSYSTLMRKKREVLISMCESHEVRVGHFNS